MNSTARLVLVSIPHYISAKKKIIKTLGRWIDLSNKLLGIFPLVGFGKSIYRNTFLLFHQKRCEPSKIN